MKAFLPWKSGVKSAVLAAECSNSPEPSGWGAARGISFSEGVSMLRATLKRVEIAKKVKSQAMILVFNRSLGSSKIYKSKRG